MSLHRLLGFHVSVPDPDQLAAYYRELGLFGDHTTGWTGTDGGARVTVDDGPFRRLDTVSIGCADDRDVAGIVRRLESGGASVALAGDGGSLTVVDPVTRVRFVVQVAEPAAPSPAAALVVPNGPGTTTRRNERAPSVFDGPRPPRRLGHLVIGTPDLAATRGLLVDGLGLRVSDEIDGVMSFLRCSTDHHNVALVESPVRLLQHYSWECDDVDHVGHTATALYRVDPARHSWGMGRHFAGSNFYWYLRDPSGAFLELYSDLDQIDDDEAWEQQGRTPFDFEHIANAWGPNLPTEFIVPDDLEQLQVSWAALDA